MFIWFVPESPRFLMSKGKNEEALKVLAHYHADGNVYVVFPPPWLSNLLTAYLQ